MSVDIAKYTAEMLTQTALVQASITTVGTLDRASPKALEVVYAAVQNALAPFDAAIAEYEAEIETTSFGGVIIGRHPVQCAAKLIEQATDVIEEERVRQARSFVSRIGNNVNNSPG